MSYMFEVYYKAPPDDALEARLLEEVSRFGGKFDYRDLPSEHSEAVSISYEFNDLAAAESAASHLHTLGYHVEGPGEYGDD
jgi:hypothetical protein